MADSLRLYSRYVSASLRSQMQYRASFLMTSLATGVVHLSEFAGLAVLFDRFGQVRGWRLAEAAMLFGMIYTSFPLGEALSHGFQRVPMLLRSGAFDRILLRPRSTLVQIMGHEVRLKECSAMGVGIVVLAWALARLGIHWTPARAALLAGALAGGAMLFMGIFIVQATVAFWTIETLELFNTVTHGGREAGQFPLELYRPWFRRLFTFVIPLACVNYLPARVLLGRVAPGSAGWWAGWVSPLVGPAFFVLCVQVWRLGIRHYRSSGS